MRAAISSRHRPDVRADAASGVRRWASVLGDTLARLLKRFSPVVMIGSDGPDLPAAFLTRAFELLRDRTDVVLGPANDGGYYLIGMRSMQPTLFERIDWSTDAVAQQTRERAGEAALQSGGTAALARP